MAMAIEDLFNIRKLFRYSNVGHFGTLRNDFHVHGYCSFNNSIISHWNSFKAIPMASSRRFTAVLDINSIFRPPSLNWNHIEWSWFKTIAISHRLYFFFFNILKLQLLWHWKKFKFEMISNSVKLIEFKSIAICLMINF